MSDLCIVCIELGLCRRTTPKTEPELSCLTNTLTNVITNTKIITINNKHIFTKFFTINITNTLPSTISTSLTITSIIIFLPP